MQLIQNAAAKSITGKRKYDHLKDDLTKLHWLDIRKRIIFKVALLAHKSVLGLAPIYLQDMFRYVHHGHTLKLITPPARTRYGERSFSVAAPRLYNNLPTYITSSDSVTDFKNKLKTFLFTISHSDLNKLTQINR